MNTLTTPSASNWLNKVPEAALSFWIIKIMCTTVGETGADFLDKPLSSGGLALSRYSASASAAFFSFMLTAILLFKQRAARTAH